jgi:peptidoglycan/xylan/chitin deacetylase (PgdA/CDA1 family)
MARELMEAGHLIGAHTVSHPLLSRLPEARQREEIVGSLDRIEQELGERPRWLAYPVGTRDAVNEATRRVAREAGVELAFNNVRGRVTAENFDSFDICRVPAETLRAPSVFAATLALPQAFL